MGDYYKTKASVEEYIRMARGHDGTEIIALLIKYYPEFEEGDSILYIGKKKQGPTH